jgi:hypothetical protein
MQYNDDENDDDDDDDNVITISTRSMLSSAAITPTRNAPKHPKQPSRHRTNHMARSGTASRAHTKRMYLVSPAVVNRLYRYQHEAAQTMAAATMQPAPVSPPSEARSSPAASSHSDDESV